ncbi:MAG: endonuclease V [Candidatus Bathyarchaeia archaeon]
MGNIEFSLVKARNAQLALSKKIVTEDQIPAGVEKVAGVDVAYLGNSAIGAVAVLDYETLKILETEVSTAPVRFPYVPTLLSFRELPAAVSAIKKLKLQPDVFLVDGHGLAHPFRCGFASHLGVVVGKPSIGVAKSKLVGEPQQIGADIFLVHRNEVVGAVLPTNVGSKSLYVSIGHKTSLRRAVEIVKRCTQNSRVPQPILQAHNVASKACLETQQKKGHRKLN